MSSEVAFLTATELAPLIQARELSPVELVDAQIERIDALDDKLRGFIHVDAEGARALARAAEQEIAAGIYRGPLHGITLAHKDIIDVQGMPTTGGSKLLPDNMPAEDATVAAHLRAAATICLGKLNLIEFASGTMGPYGYARNPWNLAANPGTSSSGSGTALAAGYVTLATGTDTGGSVRHPSTFCGLAGLRPTWGRVSRAGVMALGWSQDSIGPMARSVEDLALMLNAMAGPDRRDTTARADAVPDFRSGIDRGLKGLRIGVPDSHFFEDLDPQVDAAMKAAIEQLQALGAEMVSVSLPSAIYAGAASWLIAYTEGFAYHRDWFFKHSRDYTPAFLHKITAAGLTTAEERILSQRIRQVVTRDLREALANVDAIITPTMRGLASTEPGGSTVKTPQLKGVPEMSGVARQASLAGIPASSVPIGFADDNTPMGMQLMAAPWDEATLFRIGHAYQSDTAWHKRRPSDDLPSELPPPYGTRSSPAAAANTGNASIDAAWVLDMARLQGLSFITEDDAPKIAALLAPVKDQLAEAREVLDLRLEAPTRPAAAASSEGGWWPHD